MILSTSPWRITDPADIDDSLPAIPAKTLSMSRSITARPSNAGMASVGKPLIGTPSLEIQSSSSRQATVWYISIPLVIPSVGLPSVYPITSFCTPAVSLWSNNALYHNSTSPCQITAFRIHSHVGHSTIQYRKIVAVTCTCIHQQPCREMRATPTTSRHATSSRGYWECPLWVLTRSRH